MHCYCKERCSLKGDGEMDELTNEIGAIDEELRVLHSLRAGQDRLAAEYYFDELRQRIIEQAKSLTDEQITKLQSMREALVAELGEERAA